MINKKLLISELDSIIAAKVHPSEQYPESYHDGFNAALINIKHRINSGKFDVNHFSAKRHLSTE